MTLHIQSIWPLALLLAARLACAEQGVPANLESPTARLRADSVNAAFLAGTSVSPYREHAPLAFFSLGSLAMGGVFYGIRASMSGPRVNYVAGDRRDMTVAIGLAGLSALAAGAAYFWFSHEGEKREHAWDIGLEGAVSPEGGMEASATLRFPLPILDP